MPTPEERRAAPPHPPKPTPALDRERASHLAYRLLREQKERRGMVRGLLLLAGLVLLLSIARAGLDRVFVSGWWRQW